MDRAELQAGRLPATSRPARDDPRARDDPTARDHHGDDFRAQDGPGDDARRGEDNPGDDTRRGQDDPSDRDLMNEAGDSEESPPREPGPLLAQDGFHEGIDEQADFRERFDEDLYTDREDRPAQGNTADVAMGEQRFGSEADAYSEYAWRHPGDHHDADASAVGQSRDAADSADAG